MDTVSDAGCMSLRMRPSMTLDLAADPASDAVLSSPDVRLLKLGTPELERLVLQQYGHHHHHHHHHHQQQQQQQNSSKDRQLTLDVAVTDEDPRGFVDVQLEIHGQGQPDCDPAVIRSTTHTSTLAPRCPVVTDVGLPRSVELCPAGEPISLSSSPMSPNSGEDRARLERKRARNRLAASRCRNRKLERIDQLQRQADRLRADNARLTDDVRHLRDIVGQLRRDVLLHAACQPDISIPTTFDS